MTTNQAQDEIIDCFNMLDDWHSKYEYLLDMGNHLPDMPDQLKTDRSLVHGCNSKAWIVAEPRNNRVHFIADAETAIARGILALMLKVLDNQPAEEILKTELYFLDRIGLRENLSMTRAQGLEHLVDKIYRMVGELVG